MLYRWYARAALCLLAVTLASSTWLEGAGVYPYFEGSVVATNRRLLYGGEIFMPTWQGRTSLFFFDGRVLFDTKHRVEGNAGFGYRQMVFCNSAIFGANIFGDVHRSKRGSTFNQLSFGAELMTCYFEARANVYLPSDKKKTIDRIVFPEVILGIVPLENFVEKEFLPEFKQRTRERALSGYDVELGIRTPMPFCFTNVDLWLYGGWYQYRGDSVKNVSGGRGRLEMQIHDPLRCIGCFGTRLTLEAGIRCDSVRDGEGFLALRFAMPLYDCVPSCIPCGVQRQMSHRIVRHEQVVVNRYEEEFDRIPKRRRVKNPNGEDIRIIYVDGIGGEFGSGTFEDPFHELSQGLDALTKDFDILYITDTGNGLGLDSGGYEVPGGIPHLEIRGSGARVEFEDCILFEEGDQPEVTGPNTQDFVLDISEVKKLTLAGFQINTPGDTTEKKVGLLGNFTGDRTSITLDEMSLLGNSDNPKEVGIELTYNNGKKNHLEIRNSILRGTGSDVAQITNISGTLSMTTEESRWATDIQAGFACALHNSDQLNFHDLRGIMSSSGTSLLVNNFPGAHARLTFEKVDYFLSENGLSIVNGAGATMDVKILDSKFELMTSYGVSLTATGKGSKINVDSIASEYFSNQVGGIVNALNEGKVDFESHDSSFVSNTDNDLFVHANTDGNAILTLKGGNNVNRLFFLADNDGSIEATRKESDSVQEVDIVEQGTGTVTVDPDPFESS